MQPFNSDINIIGGIPDLGLIEVTLDQLAKSRNLVNLKELLVANNAFDFKTESTRKRFLYAMQRSILVFASNPYKLLIKVLFNGMGVPLLLIGASACTLLPIAGSWMAAVSKSFGILMLEMAAYIIWSVVAATISNMVDLTKAMYYSLHE